MALITITVTPSTTQLISGIPKTVEITADIASIIFYTVDGSIPDTSSSVYTGEFHLPTNQPSVVLKVFATNGADSSLIWSETYSTVLTNARLPHAKVVIVNPNLNPGCGSVGDPPEVLFLQPADNPVDAAAILPIDFDGYGAGPGVDEIVYPMREYDQPIPTYDIKYSETNAKGEMGRDIGTLPARAQVVYLPPAPEEGNINKATYNPKSLVTFHDGTSPNANEDTIFRPFFNGEDLSTSSSSLTNTNFRDSDQQMSGTFLRYFYNPTKNTITFYYRDNKNNRWIISEEQIKAVAPAASQQNPLYNFMSPSIGDRHVYSWHLGKGTFCI